MVHQCVTTRLPHQRIHQNHRLDPNHRQGLIRRQQRRRNLQTPYHIPIYDCPHIPRPQLSHIAITPSAITQSAIAPAPVAQAPSAALTTTKAGTTAEPPPKPTPHPLPP
ncbi:hypothetical protein DPMN_125055 [Dreissena polymorpha]|uniref:Uncharacterized protein n=1 Tax=Dreissena polymorpha TaxID=45954 RepID=A0A9D4GXH1_DREPO|nr:hypothetical protein DPMN_125055 [Dreissena polymorpha]